MAKTKQKTNEPNFYDFMRACVSDQPLAQRMLRNDPAWLTSTNSIGETVLAYLVIENYLDAARFLLDSGADMHTRDMSGDTPLIQAAGLGYREMVALLLERGADVNVKNEEQETALFKAVCYGHIEICEALLAAGADGQIQNGMGEHLWDVALPRKREQVLAVLARYGYREPTVPKVK